MNRRLAPWIAVGIASLLLAAVVAWRGAAPVQPAAGAAAIGGNFHLVNQDGRAVDQTLLNGKWSAVFFGYTHCAIACPTTLTALGSAMDELGPKAKDIQVVFISVDPQRDPPRQLKGYLANSSFPRNSIGLTGTDQEVADAAKAYKVFFQKEGGGANYDVDHTSVIYLMNPQGRFDSVLAYGQTPDQMRDGILKAMQEPHSG